MDGDAWVLSHRDIGKGRWNQVALFCASQFRIVQYRNANGAVSDRNVEPQAMLILPPLWYLVAWDPAR